MRNKFLKIILVLVSVLTATRCGEFSEVNLKNQEIRREYTTGYKDALLSKYMESLSSQTSTGRIASTIKDRINWNKSYKIVDPTKNRTSYTIPLIIEVPNQFDNLVLVDNDGDEENYIVRYKPTTEWLANKPRRGGSKTFTGAIEIVELNGDVRVSTNFENGKAVSSKNGSTNGRTNTCETWIDVVWTEVCVDGNCSISEISVTEYEVCDESGNGGGSGTGGDNGGGTEPGGDSGGSGNPPIGGGSSGSIDPVDVSYYLIPLKRGDDLSNPYDGMEARDANGVVYTYNASLNAWLMPDLVVLSENGYDMQFDNGQLINDFDGQILSTVTAIALVEPTPIGEIIVGGVLLVIFIYEAYQISTDRLSDQECQSIYVQCDNIAYGGQYHCGDCLFICFNEGEWPDWKCPR